MGNKFQDIFSDKKIGEYLRKTISCPLCKHNKVCKKIDDEFEECKDFLDSEGYKTYGSIYSMFQPIFDWIKYHYPSGEVKFLVDGMAAKMYQEHGPFVASEELKKPIGEILKKDVEDEDNG